MGLRGKKQRHSLGKKMYKRLTRQEMAIADKSFEYQGKRRGEVNTSKDTVPRRAWLATAGILV